MRNALHFGETPQTAATFGPKGADEQRSAPRYTLLIRTAKLVCEVGEFLCVIRDVSESGISVRTFHRLPDVPRMVVELQNGDSHQLEPIWQESDRAGFRFVATADIARIIASPSRYAKRAIRLNLAAPAQVETLDGRSEAVEIVDLNPHPSGSGIGIGPSGLKLLDKFGVAWKLVERGTASNSIFYGDAAGRPLADLPYVAQSGNGLPSNVTLTRQALSDVLLKEALAAGAVMREGLTVTDIVDADDHTVATLSDGTTRSVDVVVGSSGSSCSS